MAFELDPLFHNQTMVKILLSQGHLLYAGKICQKLLARDPENESLKELYEKTKTNFMKNFAGVAAKSEKTKEEEEETTEPGLKTEKLQTSQDLLNPENSLPQEQECSAEEDSPFILLETQILEEKTEILAEKHQMPLAEKLFNLEYLLLKVQERRL